MLETYSSSEDWTIVRRGSRMDEYVATFKFKWNGSSSTSPGWLVRWLSPGDFLAIAIVNSDSKARLYANSSNYFIVIANKTADDYELWQVSSGTFTKRRNGGTVAAGTHSLSVEVRSGSIERLPGNMADYNATVPAGKVGLWRQPSAISLQPQVAAPPPSDRFPVPGFQLPVVRVSAPLQSAP